MEEIKKVAIVEKVLGHGWVDCDSPQCSQSLHQLVECVEICLSIHYLQRVEEAVLRVANDKEDKVDLQEIPQLGYPCC
jgi:hypothetical protein